MDDNKIYTFQKGGSLKAWFQHFLNVGIKYFSFTLKGNKCKPFNALKNTITIFLNDVEYSWFEL